MTMWVIVLLAVVMAASRITAASDTLLLTSHRVINACSGEQRWLISASIGEVKGSDSLMSFDITIGFDTALLRPTDGLISGTLSEQMKFADISPSFNFQVPGEMRVGAFTITRNVQGNLPLFAIAGEYKQQCGTGDTLTLPWEPDFNEEFKGSVNVFRTDTVYSVAIPVADPSQGVRFELDSLQIKDADSSLDVASRIITGTPSSTVLRVVYTVSDVAVCRISGFTTNADVATSNISEDGSQLTVDLTVTEQETLLTLHIDLARGTDSVSAVITCSATRIDSCSCTEPTLQDDLTILIERPTVSAKLDLHEGSPIRITQSNNTIRIQSLHGAPQQISIHDTFGRVFAAVASGESSEVVVPIEHLSSGFYLVVIQTESGMVTRKLLR